MELVETFYLGCEDDGSIAEPGYSAIQRWCGHTLPFTLTTVNNLSRHFLSAEMAMSEGCLDQPYRLSCLIPDYFIKKKKDYKTTDHRYPYKEEDEESVYFKWKWYLENMLPPEWGMIVSIYSCSRIDNKDSTWQSQYLWRSKDIWKSSNTDVNTISYHVPENRIIDWKDNRLDECVEFLKEFSYTNGYNLIPVSYSTKMDELHNTLLKTRMHFGYIGGSYFHASLTGTPTLGFGIQEKNIEAVWPGQKARIPYRYSLWGSVMPNAGHTLRWVRDLNLVNNRPVDWQKVTNDPTELLTLIDRLE